MEGLSEAFLRNGLESLEDLRGDLLRSQVLTVDPEGDGLSLWSFDSFRSLIAEAAAHGALHRGDSRPVMKCFHPAGLPSDENRPVDGIVNH